MTTDITADITTDITTDIATDITAEDLVNLLDGVDLQRSELHAWRERMRAE